MTASPHALLQTLDAPIEGSLQLDAQPKIASPDHGHACAMLDIYSSPHLELPVFSFHTVGAGCSCSFRLYVVLR